MLTRKFNIKNLKYRIYESEMGMYKTVNVVCDYLICNIVIEENSRIKCLTARDSKIIFFRVTCTSIKLVRYH